VSTAIKEPPRVVRSEIDSDRFGFPIARVDDVRCGQIQTVLERCQREGIVMVIVRCDGGDIDTVHDLEDAGLRLMDAQIRFTAEADANLVADPRLRPFRSGDLDGVVAIAKRAFTGYAGHYHADQRLAPELCDLVYPSWAARCCSGDAADHVIVAESAGRPVAFTAFSRVNGDEGRLVLGAVLPEARGERLYAAMTSYGLWWCGTQGLRRITAVTQTANIAAQQSWARAGLLPDSVSYTFHGWLDTTIRGS